MKTLLLLLLCCTAFTFCNAQLTADFVTSDGIASGCSPYSVTFKNTTKGAGSKAIYKWDLGNNNTSSLENPGASYSIEKIYTVVLSVVDSGITSTKQLIVTVYKKPIVDFTISNTQGCVPFTTLFTSNATAGDGSISNYFWDFGDGTTSAGATLSSVPHNFTSTQLTRIDLVVINSFGCQNVLHKSAAITVQQQPIAKFSIVTPVLCKITDTLFLKNNSSGSGTLSYIWNFGDSSTATSVDAKHIYLSKGTFDIALTVTSNFAPGCIATLKKIAGTLVDNFNSAIDTPTVICTNTMANFTSKSSGTATTTRWLFSDDSYKTIYTGNTLGKVFSTTGKILVKMINTNGACIDTVKKTLFVNLSPTLNGFVDTNNVMCNLPVLVSLQDTSVAAVKWLWNLGGSTVASATTQVSSALYQQEGTFAIGLTITDQNGCMATVNKPIVIKTLKFIISSTASTSPTDTSGCPGFAVSFIASPAANIATYIWDFGDSTSTSTSATPTHIFNKEGSNQVSLQYTTKDGCSGTTYFAKDVTVYRKPVVDFVVADTVICGSNTVTYADSSSKPTTAWSWFFGDGSFALGTTNPSIKHKYYDSGYYSVKLIALNHTCGDSIEKKQYVKVLPLFGAINSIKNTCNGLRDSVYFSPKFRFVDSGVWDYGDGTSEIISPNTTSLVHKYSKSGSYVYGITITNSYCTLKDSAFAYVLLKQSPQLTPDRVLLCLSDSLNVQINGLENNPYPNNNYTVSQWQFENATTFTGSSNRANNYAFANTFVGKLWQLKQGSQQIRAILKTDYFGCNDTSNYISITTKGPTAGFAVITNQNCFKQPVNFKDTSAFANGIPIVKREWLFGDSTTARRNDAAIFPHNYINPGSYAVKLTVTDADGCFSLAQNLAKPLQVVGPKANFTWNPGIILVGTTATYTNTSNAFGSSNTAYLWSFSSNGTNSTNSTSVNKSYNIVTIDTVRLIATNTNFQCADTIVKLVPIKRIGLAFRFTTAFINNVDCPPLAAYFTTTLLAVNSVSWSFGDGTFAGNNQMPTHIYTKPGLYKVTLYGVGANNYTDSVFDYISIQGPYATIKASSVLSCVPTTVTLTATAINAVNFIWDFGDGTVSTLFDSVAMHQYTTPGIYVPSLILKDSVGCSAIFSLPNSLLIDGLTANMLLSPKAICRAGIVAFSNQINSITDSLNAASTHYHWNFGTGNVADTSNQKSPVFYYPKVGKYPVGLQIATAAGCIENLYDTVNIKPIAVTAISSPTAICQSDTVQFLATSFIPNGVTYDWQFGNGAMGNTSQPSPQTYLAADTPYVISLISTFDGCSDTSMTSLKVNANPVVNIIPKTKNICLGDSLLFSAQNGISYQWQNAAASATNTYLAKPISNSNYTVIVKNTDGCTSKDVASITVSQPFKIFVSQDAFVCLGSSTQLQASGTDNFKWIKNTVGLPNINSAMQVIIPNYSSNYTVVGYDKFGCFTDTATIAVTLLPVPKISTGGDLILSTGSTATLTTTYTSDVIKWVWSPSNYLNCSTCPSPIATPRLDIQYLVTGTTKYGCEAKDTINIKLQCVQGNLFIPSAFTPNKNGLNDMFYPLGRGIRLVKHFTIFNRAGEKIFESDNFNINDASAGWNGMLNGNEQGSGVYVYMIEVICDTGDIFLSKGTVTLIR